jgi:hypothetical protein
MVDHCANPACRKPLHYLREGKVFLFSRKNYKTNGAGLPDRLEHFWLCGTCSREWTLAADGQNGVKLVEMRRRNVPIPVNPALSLPAA